MNSIKNGLALVWVVSLVGLAFVTFDLLSQDDYLPSILTVAITIPLVVAVLIVRAGFSRQTQIAQASYFRLLELHARSLFASFFGIPLLGSILFAKRSRGKQGTLAGVHLAIADRLLGTAGTTFFGIFLMPFAVQASLTTGDTGPLQATSAGVLISSVIWLSLIATRSVPVPTPKSNNRIILNFLELLPFGENALKRDQAPGLIFFAFLSYSLTVAITVVAGISVGINGNLELLNLLSIRFLTLTVSLIPLPLPPALSREALFVLFSTSGGVPLEIAVSVSVVIFVSNFCVGVLGLIPEIARLFKRIRP